MVEFRDLKRIAGKIWYFIWEDNSIWSWLVNILLAFILIRFAVYPFLGLIFATNYPIVAVVSGSMEHDKAFDAWWEQRGEYYENNWGITKREFEKFSFKNGFNKGDIMILFGIDTADIDIGDVIVFRSSRKDPIIHRVIIKEEEINNTYLFQTKGDNNARMIQDDMDISKDRLLGKAVLRIPFLGWVKIIFVDLMRLMGVLR